MLTAKEYKDREYRKKTTIQNSTKEHSFIDNCTFDWNIQQGIVEKFIQKIKQTEKSISLGLLEQIKEEFGENFSPMVLDNDHFHYDGDKLRTQRHGHGKLYFSQKNPTFEKIKENIFDDSIEIRFSLEKKAVKIYEGKFLCNTIHCETGSIYNTNGQLYYKGPVFFGKKYGKGVLYHCNGIIQYDGQFINDLPEDESGRLYSESTGFLVYEGKLSGGKRNGLGIEYSRYTQGLVLYKGEFLDDFRHGKGVEYDENGNFVTVGVWSYGRVSHSVNTLM